ncbi:SOS response-associated peptidase [Aliibacillus thermotolerans]|uniref:Abasic site processing protein n=1 Tax=Aliibacillus thermotolerans TaxID=1834418 RepID=A0ABW0U6N5_9BACI|nr:SOS response-associated peptidase [Aliibacillus thermotolerans]MDA3129084.1 hypothetical protein [Aliibacillus thermotolerans]
MCGRFTLTASLPEIVKEFDVTTNTLTSYQPNYNVAPSQDILAMIHDGTSTRLGTLEWGFIPSWAQGKKRPKPMINARSETAHKKPTFQRAFFSRRCLLPADGFYEWKANEDGTKKPYRIQLTDRQLFSFAGIWEKAVNTKGETVFTCAILTMEANEEMEKIHHRMPIILPKKLEKEWIRPNHSLQTLQEILSQSASVSLHMYPVSSNVNAAQNNDPSLIEEVSE